MSRPFQKLLAAVVFAGAAATAFSAAAQPGAGRGAGPGMARPGMGMMAGPATPQSDPAASLRALLQLRPNQESALQAYAAALTAARQDSPMTMAMGDVSTPERLTRMEQVITRHHNAMRAAIEATRRFYAQLDPAQQRAFDELPPMLAMGGGMGMGMGMGMMGPGMGMGTGTGMGCPGMPMMGGNPSAPPAR